ncbi:MAG: hypothetical protein H6738_21790 [Alphaproteobacteria bacterium]|nr:hypothetical protein [Alphaproteobacteria bacterium]MCB9699430.1 hypothetical protein [Alphaproteobacteria bacterium]
MLVFATEIPLVAERDASEVLGVARTWLAGSPHTPIPEDRFPLPDQGAIRSMSWEGQTVSAGLVNGSHGQTAGVQLEWVEEGRREWTAEVVADHDGATLWVSVRLYCSALQAAPSLPTPNKPYIVRQLLALGTADDGGLEVRDRPHQLPDTDEGIALAADLIRGRRENRLPVVYVSVDGENHPVLDHFGLARTLGGVAHVVIEPSRGFSFRLQGQVAGVNPYGGAVGIYWPQATGRSQRFFARQYEDSAEMLEEVSLSVRRAVANRRPMARCSWSRLRSYVSRAALERLRAESDQPDAASLDEFVTAFDRENTALKEDLQSAEREIARLQAEVLRAQASSGEGLLKVGSERDLYAGETGRVVVSAIQRAAESAPTGSRRRDVLAALADANSDASDADRILAEVKRVLTGYRTLGSKEKNALEKLGFRLVEDGKHHKLYFGDDDRYVVALSKTSSDGRAGLNSVSQVRKTFF